MSKHNKAKLEKVERNEVYALRFKKKDKDERHGKKRPVAKFANWCRITGHPASCSCNLPSREEVVAASSRRR